MDNLTVVEFVQSVAPYRAGEKAAFSRAQANAYARQGVGKIVREDVPAVDPDTIKAQRAAQAEETARALRVSISDASDGRRAPASTRG